jgi:hypothetical protein
MKEENNQRKINAMEVIFIYKILYIYFALIFILISYYYYRHYAYFYKEYFPKGLITLVLKLLIF